MCVLKKDELEDAKKPSDSSKYSNTGESIYSSPSPVKPQSQDSKAFSSSSLKQNTQST